MSARTDSVAMILATLGQPFAPPFEAVRPRGIQHTLPGIDARAGSLDSPHLRAAKLLQLPLKLSDWFGNGRALAGHDQPPLSDRMNLTGRAGRSHARSPKAHCAFGERTRTFSGLPIGSGGIPGMRTARIRKSCSTRRRTGLGNSRQPTNARDRNADRGLEPS